MMKVRFTWSLLFGAGLLTLGYACSEDETLTVPSDEADQWTRDARNPVFRDSIPSENYEAASDAHVFFDDRGELRMIYTGDVNGTAAIKLANGNSWHEWHQRTALISTAGSLGLDLYKETGFYRRTSTGRHQIYYIGYSDENTYESQVFLAEADSLVGPYTQLSRPVVSRGEIAGKAVYSITSPSVLEHEGLLYMTFIGWNDSPDKVTEVWVMGAISSDEGRSWSDYQLVDTRIGMEGQVTKTANGEFVAVRTGEYAEREAIFYATASHPFGPWSESPEPILVQNGSPLEKDEIIAPQITIEPTTNREYLFYTGANHQLGWWIMLAQPEP